MPAAIGNLKGSERLNLSIPAEWSLDLDRICERYNMSRTQAARELLGIGTKVFKMCEEGLL